jgi:mannose-6-phosphate isomerase-like protein (cupin superfamily)
VQAQIQLPGEGRSLAAVGVSVVLKSAAEDTDGRWTLYEYTAPPQFAGPPAHWHKETDEAFFVLEGTLRFEIDGETVDAPAGGYAGVPPGIVHRFSSPFDEPARFLGLLVPAACAGCRRGARPRSPESAGPTRRIPEAG